LLLAQILDKNDYERVGGKFFVKKGGWRKIAFAFQVSFEVPMQYPVTISLDTMFVTTQGGRWGEEVKDRQGVVVVVEEEEEEEEREGEKKSEREQDRA
jgi:hypothetical protein